MMKVASLFTGDSAPGSWGPCPRSVMVSASRVQMTGHPHRTHSPHPQRCTLNGSCFTGDSEH